MDVKEMMIPKLKDTHNRFNSLDERTVREYLNRPTLTRANRDNSELVSWDLLEYSALEPLAKVMEHGADKYGKDNWKNGLPIPEIINHLLAHIYAYLRGERIDKDSGELQVGHILSNAMFLSYYDNLVYSQETQKTELV